MVPRLHYWVVAMASVLAASQVASERSSQDSSFSLTAQQIMQTAMRLPPHILPTLDELDPKKGNQKVKDIGVYVPDSLDPVGVYVPKKRQKKHQPSTDVSLQQRDPELILTPPAAATTGKPKRHVSRPPTNRRPIFSVSIEPNSPIGKLYDLSQNKPKELLARLPKLRRLRNGAKNRHANKRRRKKDSEISGGSVKAPPPYKFEKANFQLPQIEESLENYADGSQTLSRRPIGLQAVIPPSSRNVHKFVPIFVKEALAKSFLRKPERYLKRLRGTKKKAATEASHERSRKQAVPAPQPMQQVLLPPQKNSFNNLAFDDRFPWEDASLTKYDNFPNYVKERVSTTTTPFPTVASEAFKTGEYLGWEYESDIRKRADNPPPSEAEATITKTLCFCCDEYENQHQEKAFINADLPHRKKRTVKIDDHQQSRQIMRQEEYIHDSITCLNQDPIEVVLVLHEKESSKKPRRRFTSTTSAPEAAENLELIDVFGPNALGYDPVKMNFISTPSSFQVRRISLEDISSPMSPVEIVRPSQNNLIVDHQQTAIEATTLESTSEEPLEGSNSSSSESQNAVLSLAHAEVPIVKNTLPGYTILRLLTGG